MHIDRTRSFSVLMSLVESERRSYIRSLDGRIPDQSMGLDFPHQTILRIYCELNQVNFLDAVDRYFSSPQEAHAVLSKISLAALDFGATDWGDPRLVDIEQFS
jgi:hypothetical protein